MKKTKGVFLASKQKSKHESKHAGLHVIADFWGGKIIEDSKEIRQILLEVSRASQNTPLVVKVHKFEPRGITGFALLAESHISIHTWPEMNYAAIDIFSCGSQTKPLDGLAYLKKVFQPEKVKVKTLKRG